MQPFDMLREADHIGSFLVTADVSHTTRVSANRQVAECCVLSLLSSFQEDACNASRWSPLCFLKANPASPLFLHPHRLPKHLFLTYYLFVCHCVANIITMVRCVRSLYELHLIHLLLYAVPTIRTRTITLAPSARRRAPTQVLHPTTVCVFR
jgi:hypothetical protein